MDNNWQELSIFKDQPGSRFFVQGAEGWETCRKELIAVCDIKDHEELTAECTRDFDTAMHYFHVFVQTGLDCAPRGTPPRKLFMTIAGYVVRNAPPELEGVLKKGIEMLSKYITPTGFTLTGKPAYSLDQVCKVLDMDEEEVLYIVQDRCILT